MGVSVCKQTPGIKWATGRIRAKNIMGDTKDVKGIDKSPRGIHTQRWGEEAQKQLQAEVIIRQGQIRSGREGGVGLKKINDEALTQLEVGPSQGGG